MNYLSANEIRRKWLNFFQQNDHLLLASASLIPVNDDSLLWINSGVAALKPYFDGREKPPYPRLANSQKSLRTNDIENVGYTARHHTLFEMLGNFSIGDYFKKEAIIFAWEFLTSKQWLNLDPNKLYVTVYIEDQEAYSIWKDIIGLDPKRIILGNRNMNFWDMGQGPCGPNTEIFFDRGVTWDPLNYGIKMLQEDLENDRYLEIWNIVFSEFNNDGNKNYQELPRKNIDTGAGLERLACIMQETPTSFETDLFLPIINECFKFTKFKYDPNNIFEKPNDQTKINIAFKVISDHIRAITFAIGDGVFPSNKERGYVIRRLIRRSIVFAHRLNINAPFLHKLVPIVIKIMKDYYPNLFKKESVIVEAVKKEESNYFIKIKEGYNLFCSILKKEQEISAENAFKLYDTFGFPIELTMELAKDSEVAIDFAGYEKLLEQQKEKARNARKGQDIVAMNLQNKLLLDLKVCSKFIGYDSETNDNARVIAMFYEDELLDSAKDQIVDVVLDATPFYAEKGGQASDTGLLSNATMQGQVIDVKLAPNKQHIHRVQVNGQLKSNTIVNATINHEQRKYGMKNHSGTHLLHAAIRKVLGSEAMQIGSFNNYQYLRIDIAYNEKITALQIDEISSCVNQFIASNDSLEVYLTTYEKALKMNALAFFDEKYDQEVRVVKFGDYSVELCGGTHVKQTGDIEKLLITNVESKGLGVYRFHGITSNKTINTYFEQEEINLQATSKNLLEKYRKINSKNEQIEILLQKITNYQIQSQKDLEHLKKITAQLQIALKKWAQESENQLITQQMLQFKDLPILKLSNYDLLIFEFNNIENKTLKNLALHYLKLNNKLVVIFTSSNKINKMYSIVIALSEHLIREGLNAKTIIQYLTTNTSGNGGGNMGFAMGSYTDNNVMKELLEKIKQEAMIWNI